MKRYLIILTVALTNCDYINTEQRRLEKVETYKQYFYENKEVFERLVEDVQKDKSIKLGLFQDVGGLDDNKKTKLLKSLNVRTLVTDNTNCGYHSVEFTTEWTNFPIGQMFLTKDCPDEKSKKGNYWKNGFIDVWGLGDGWVIWVDSDPV